MARLERETGFEPATSTLAIKSSGIVFGRTLLTPHMHFIRPCSDQIDTHNADVDEDIAKPRLRGQAIPRGAGPPARRICEGWSPELDLCRYIVYVNSIRLAAETISAFNLSRSGAPARFEEFGPSKPRQGHLCRCVSLEGSTDQSLL